MMKPAMILWDIVRGHDPVIMGAVVLGCKAFGKGNLSIVRRIFVRLQGVERGASQ